MAYQTRDLVEAMQADSGVPLSRLKVDGGAAVNDGLMQFQSDLLGAPLVRPAVTETTALGAALLAGLAVGSWNSLDDVARSWRVDREFTPQLDAARREELYRGWKQAVGRTLTR
jgi:glycerol kinase